MAHITRRPGIRHFRGSPTGYVLHLRRGRLRHEGTARAFWFRPLSSAISEVPVEDQELTLMLHARTADLQEVSVQATVGWRVADPARAAQRLDFSLDLDTGHWSGEPLEQAGRILVELAQDHVARVMATLEAPQALATGAALTREGLVEHLDAAPRVAETGLAVVGAQVSAVRVEPDLERALQTPARERVQQEADRATFERRALAVERERAISENEIQTKIELAVRREELVTREGRAQRVRAAAEVEAEQVRADGQAARDRLGAEVAADNRELAARAEAAAVREVGVARADAERAGMAAYADVPPAVLLALAARELAGNLPQITNLTLTPDLLAPVLARLARES